MNIKIKLLELGRRQTDLVVELRKRGYKIQPSELSSMLSGMLATQKTEEIKRVSEEIIEEWKKATEK